MLPQHANQPPVWRQLIKQRLRDFFSGGFEHNHIIGRLVFPTRMQRAFNQDDVVSGAKGSQFLAPAFEDAFGGSKQGLILLQRNDGAGQLAQNRGAVTGAGPDNQHQVAGRDFRRLIEPGRNHGGWKRPAIAQRQ